MDVGRIAVRALFTFISLLILMRVAHKRMIAEVTPFDFIVSLILGDLIDDALFAEVPFAQFIIAATTIVGLEIVVAHFSARSVRFHNLVSGVPRIFVEHGRSFKNEMNREQLNDQNLAELMRKNGLDKKRWKEVWLGHLEISDDFSVLKEAGHKVVQKKDFKWFQRTGEQ